MKTQFEVPFYAKLALIFIGLFGIVFILHIGQDIILPVVYATLLAILLNPFVNLLVRIGFNRNIAIATAVLCMLAFLFGVLYLISTQLSMFSESYPKLKLKFESSSNELINWISHTFNIQRSGIDKWIQNTENEAIRDFAVGEKIGQVGQFLMVAALLPVYLIMILYYKPLFIEFIKRLFKAEHHLVVDEVLTNSKNIIQSYLTGLFFELLIVGVLNSVGLLVIGIDYAIIIGMLGALLNIIPYLGSMIAVAVPMTLAFITKDSYVYPLLVLGLYTVVQFLDNNLIVPKIVASRVQINAFVSVIVVVLGGTLWGIPGMFLSIPVTGIIKVIFDHIDGLKPWGYLLGNIVPTKKALIFTKLKL